MAKYYINTTQQSNGDNEVHREDCRKLPSTREYLGDFTSCGPAVTAAKRRGWRNADGCAICSPACHTS